MNLWALHTPDYLKTLCWIVVPNACLVVVFDICVHTCFETGYVVLCFGWLFKFLRLFYKRLYETKEQEFLDYRRIVCGVNGHELKLVLKLFFDIVILHYLLLTLSCHFERSIERKACDFVSWLVRCSPSCPSLACSSRRSSQATALGTGIRSRYAFGNEVSWAPVFVACFPK